MDKLGLHGYIKIVSDSGKLNTEVENAITDLFAEVVAHKGIDLDFVLSSPIEAGQTHLLTNGVAQAGSLYNSRENNKYNVTVYLLNLSAAEKAALSSDSTVLPIYSSSKLALDQSKIVGYATANITASGNKEGYLIPMSGTNLMTYKKHGLQFRWDAGVLSGSFNCVAIGMDVMKDANIYNGVSLYRGLESNNYLANDYPARGYFMIPNVKSADGTVVWTAANEILLGGHSDSDYTKARYVLNLDTGEQTAIDPNDVRYDIPLPEAKNGNQAVFGDYWVYQRRSSYYDYNIKTKSYDDKSGSYCGFFIKDGYLYIHSDYNDTNKTLTFYAYNTNMQRVSAADITITIPSELYDRSYLRIYNCGSKYLLAKLDTSSTNGYPTPLTCALLFTNLQNIGGSITDILPKVYAPCCIWYDGQPYFFTSGDSDGSDLSNTSHYFASGGSSTSFTKQGLRFCSLGMFGNMFSYKVYDTDQQIPTGDGLRLQYNYQIN